MVGFSVYRTNFCFFFFSLRSSDMALREEELSKRPEDTPMEVMIEKTPWPASPEHLHGYMRAGLSSEEAQFLYDVPENEKDRIFHKVDWRLLPMLAVMYLVSHLDRSVSSGSFLQQQHHHHHHHIC